MCTNQPLVRCLKKSTFFKKALKLTKLFKMFITSWEIIPRTITLEEKVKKNTCVCQLYLVVIYTQAGEL